MKSYILISLLVVIFVYTGCSTSSVNQNTLPDTKGFSYSSDEKSDYKQATKDSKQKELYDEAMNNRKLLYKKDIDYIPWMDHLEIDVILMPKLMKLSKDDVNLYVYNRYKIVATKGNSILIEENGIFFLNYKNSLAGIKKQALVNGLNKVGKTSEVENPRKSSTTKNKSIEKARRISFQSRGIPGEKRLEQELSKIYPSEVARYSLDKYQIIPTKDNSISSKENRIYIPINATYIDLLNYVTR